MLKLRTDIKYVSPEGKLTQAGVEAFQGQIDALSADPSGLTVSSFAASAVVTEAEGIAANDVDTALPTSAAVKDYADATVMPTVAAAAVDAIGAYALLRQTTTSTARSGQRRGQCPAGKLDDLWGHNLGRWQHDQHLAVAAGFVR